MRILLCSHFFSPSVGGTETVARLLAEEFSAMGHEVTVITQTLGPPTDESYVIIRQPSIGGLLAAAWNCDVILQNNISLQTLLPLFITGKRIVLAHHTWLTRVDGHIGLRDRLKLTALKFCRNIAISQALALTIPASVTIIPNPFDADEFVSTADVMRDKDIVFVGRLVSDKGCDVALRALSLLREQGFFPTFTVVGDGSERIALTALAARLGLADQVSFLGTIEEGRGRILAEHKVLVIPSRWNEPFGLVALEGIASGCTVVASDGGGLPEAVGACGICVPRGNVASLAQAFRVLLSDGEKCAAYTNGAPEHLRHHTPRVVARQYEAVLAAGTH